MVGSTALPFSDSNPKPAGTPDNHTHSWQVFVKGLDDVDITYWLRRVQFKLHESIPNYVRMIDGAPGKPFVVQDTGWGEFDITIKLYYVNESGEKPQTLYHYLRLHPYGRTEEEKQAMMTQNGQVRAWSYEEQLFNEPYEAFYQLLTVGAVPRGWKIPSSATTAATTTTSTTSTTTITGTAASSTTTGKGKGKGKAPPPLPDPECGEVWERTAMIPSYNRPGQPFSRETEAAEMKKLKDAQEKTEEMTHKLTADIKLREQLLAKLKTENQSAVVMTSQPA